MDPQALRERPDIPWYYEVFIDHFHILSFSRIAGVNKANPIDIITMLKYNKDIVKMDNSAGFISIIQSLDAIYLGRVKETDEG